MKKLFIILSAVLTLAACSKSELAEINEPKQEEAVSTPVTFNVIVNEAGATKALKSAWADGDVIYVKFQNIDTKFLTLTYNGSSWVAQGYDNASTPATTTFDVSDFSGIDAGNRKLGAVHYPVVVDASLDGSGNLNFSKNSQNPSVYCLSEKAVTYTFDGTNVNVTLNLEKPQNVVLFHISGIANASDYTLQVTNSESSTCAKAPGTNRITSVAYTESTSGLALGDPIPCYADADGVIFSVWINKSYLGSAKNWTFKLIHSSGQEYTVTGSKNIVAGNQYGLPQLNTFTWTCKGVFSISSGKKVFFSPGNLQYQASTGTWRFAEHQWDAIGAAAGNITSTNRDTQTDWIDLFGWGTSGYDHGAVIYQPWSSDNTAEKYYAYGNAGYDLNQDGQNGKADWGYNAISNGGNTENSGWRTLSKDEWTYLLETRSTSTINGKSDARYALAEINTDATSCHGMIMFPDIYTAGIPEGVTWTNPFSNKINTGTNWAIKCTTAGWAALEKAGCVFLPVTGYRYNNSVDNVDTGYYWTSTYHSSADQKMIWDMKIVSGTETTIYDYYRQAGMAVRLVKEVE